MAHGRMLLQKGLGLGKGEHLFHDDQFLMTFGTVGLP
jgi:hypothetical protein